jgi:hypothetical protein
MTDTRDLCRREACLASPGSIRASIRAVVSGWVPDWEKLFDQEPGSRRKKSIRIQRHDIREDFGSCSQAKQSGEREDVVRVALHSRTGPSAAGGTSMTFSSRPNPCVERSWRSRRGSGCRTIG